MDFYIIQLASIIVAWAIAKMQGPTIDLIENAGAPPRVWLALHTYGLFIKATFVGTMFTIEFMTVRITGVPHHWEAILYSVVSGLWIYLLFDIILNKTRRIKPRPWYYLSINDADGRRLLDWFGPEAGKVKAYICAGLIIIFNVLKVIFL